MEANLDYYRRRAAAEAAAAEAAADPKVRRVHLELARRYEEQVAALQSEPRETRLHLVSAA